MSVYTVVSLETVQQFALAFDMQVTGLTPIQNGIENSNYFVALSDGRELVLTLFEELGAADAEVLSRLMQRLFQQGVPVAVPLPDLSGKRLHTLAGKPAQLAPRLPGRSPLTPTVWQTAQMGAGLAQLHLALEHDPLPTEQTLTIEYNPAWWVTAKDDVMAALHSADQQLMNHVFSLYGDIKQRYPTLPQGLIHGDVFRDNTLFVGDTLSAILDYSTVAHDDWLMDLAITINDFCTQYPDVALDMDRVVALVNAYSDVRKLSDQEKLSLQVYLVMAACRFWILRLQVGVRNHTEDRVGEDVLVKDPDEMRRMVLARLAAL
jgi:homoserine kinase type II